ncbi:motility associated factor glycosyltransferase family protein [Jeotgalibacillus sp. R-1-5s-1]|uniref:motility associated factor glycosyltransferase family protein n=1 Tax=Jeotgalibacillus sp. R-1-5s-1 TaxID=2555897 RepID=UPI00141B0D36|nr:6-hydroxymethylpterin diphosphokinase MptE-like protein [Jeotgalibacillus sp. R-1-5s-1]
MSTITTDLYLKNTYKKNIDSLSKIYPEVAERLKDTTVNNNKYSLKKLKKNNYNLEVKYKNLFYYNGMDPFQDSKSELQKLNLVNTKMALFLGLGLGYELLAFVKEVSQKQKTMQIMVVEKEWEIFKLALMVNDFSSFINNKNFLFIIGKNDEELPHELFHILKSNNRILYLKATNPVYHTSSLRVNKDYYVNLIKVFRETGLRVIEFYGNDPEDSLIGIENMLENIIEIVNNPGIDYLYNKFKGKPAIIVSTGPSLNKNKHLLKGLEDKALIICPDASLRILIGMGIKPHLVTSLERVPQVIELVKGFKKEEVEDIHFAACPVIQNSVYEAYPGPRVIVYRDFSHFNWLGIEKGTLNIKASSGNMAFKLAEALGCNPIILTGQDLAFSRDGTTHAKGADLGERQESFLKGNYLKVMGNDGELIETTPVWNMFRKGYEEDIHFYSGQCINSTEGGAYIQGTEIMPLAESIQRHINKSFNPLELIKESLSNFKDSDRFNDINRVKILLDETILDTDKIIEICNSSVQMINEKKIYLEEIVLNRHTEFSDRKLININNEILKCKSKIQTAYPKTFGGLIMHTIQSYFIKFEIDINAIPSKYSSNHQAIAESSLLHEVFFINVAKMTKKVQECLKTASEKLN